MEIGEHQERRATRASLSGVYNATTDLPSDSPSEPRRSAEDSDDKLRADRGDDDSKARGNRWNRRNRSLTSARESPQQAPKVPWNRLLTSARESPQQAPKVRWKRLLTSPRESQEPSNKDASLLLYRGDAPGPTPNEPPRPYKQKASSSGYHDTAVATLDAAHRPAEVAGRGGEIIPSFSDEANGIPHDWEIRGEPCSRKNMKSYSFPELSRSSMSVDNFITFLKLRKCGNIPVYDKLYDPSNEEGGWHKFKLKDSHSIPSNYKTGWHGTKVQALYSILCDGRLRESAEEDAGRTKGKTRGVYLHDSSCREKAEGYASYAIVIPGVSWRVMFEVSFDPNGRNRLSHERAKQIALPSESVHLVALWLLIKNAREMRGHDWCVGNWVPNEEMRPAHLHTHETRLELQDRTDRAVVAISAAAAVAPSRIPSIPITPET